MVQRLSPLPANAVLVPKPLALAVALALSGCGGGGSSPTPVEPAAITFAGVAATGAPMAGAVVTIVSATGSEVCHTAADSHGHYQCSVAADAAAPFVVTANDGEQSMYSSAASAESGTINVTPLTTLIVARLSPSGDPARFADEVKTDPAVATPEKVQARVEEVQALIAPLSAAAGDTVNPLTGDFSADGSGHDKVLDSLQITIKPEGESSNIEVTMKVTPASDEAPPVSVSFRSNEAPPPPPVESIKPEDLVGTGTAALVSGFLAQMKACYALPLAQRIDGVADGAASATGGPASVKAAECKALFVDNSPAAYLDNGLEVGSGRGFPGLFREASTGAAFDRGNFEYQWANGDMLITFRSTTTTGAIGHSTLTLRNQDGKLKAVGNHYAYDASVRPYIFDREFPLQTAYNYFGTGYNVAIANRVDANGNPVFKEAVVTTPTGRQLVYRPLAGRSQLALVRANGETSGTSVEVFKAAYANTATPGNPADKDTGLVFTSNQLTDDQLRSIPNQGVWTIEWTHADSNVPNVKQTYRTIERAATIGETRQAKFAQFTDALKASWLARADVQAFKGLTFPAVSSSAPNTVHVETEGGGDGWLVPEGAEGPTSVTVFGRSAAGARFNDSAPVATTDRKATVSCSRQSNADLHCDDSTGVNQFAEGGWVWSLELWGRTLRQIERTKQIALYKLAD